MRVLVTGATGFAGQYLTELLLSRDHVLYGTYLTRPSSRGASGVELLQCDLRNKNRVQAIVRRIRPQRIYHLAAYSSAVNSFDDVHLVHDTNFWGTYNLLEAV